ncbi:hypothetical protein RhiirC2_803509 [Rhizophagus irregularis]|uniref:Uncharacterized protein n=1 Tax=Rhizophagus irregularis TaxID=588596 RepID=A0A2N1LHJ2_9GLOM|nr:hypothetical protein RhiirC2_803509 [Rhizophagus irregularis]
MQEKKQVKKIEQEVRVENCGKVHQMGNKSFFRNKFINLLNLIRKYSGKVMQEKEQEKKIEQEVRVENCGKVQQMGDKPCFRNKFTTLLDSILRKYSGKVMQEKEQEKKVEQGVRVESEKVHHMGNKTCLFIALLNSIREYSGKVMPEKKQEKKIEQRNLQYLSSFTHLCIIYYSRKFI